MTSEKDQPPIDDAARARFAETMSKLTAPDAAEVLFKEFEPDIRQFDTQYQQQMPTMVAMGRSYLKGSCSRIRSFRSAKGAGHPDHRSPGHLGRKDPIHRSRAGQADPGRCHRRRAAAGSEVLDEARGLNFEQSAPKLKIAFNSLKKVLALYGFSIDQTLDSATTELVSSTADEAVVKVSYKLLDTPFQANVDMVRVGERWYSKDTIEKLKARNAEKAMATATPAAANG